MTLTQTFVLFFVALCATILTVLLTGLHQNGRISQKKSYNCEIKGAPTSKDSQDFGVHVEVADALATLIYVDGAGSWPPRADHHGWPSALSPYKNVYQELVHYLPTANPSLDDNTNNERRHNFRSLMRNALTERFQMDKVEAIMQTAELELWDLFLRDAYNGFYCCIAVLRHAYRWATIPVVKVAQLERVVNFPPELDLPWRFLQHKFDVSADSGNNTANVLLNFDHRGERVYKINVGLGYPVEATEETFFRLFYDLEIQALPIYHAMVYAIANFRGEDKNACCKHLETVSSHLRSLLQLFYKNITHAHVPQSVWLSHIQGFQGWGVGRMIDGRLVKFDGLSGNHVLDFQAIDAFLGLDQYLSEENMLRYIPVNQRIFCKTLKKSCFRHCLGTDTDDLPLQLEFSKIVKHMRVCSEPVVTGADVTADFSRTFRAAHRRRVMPYLEQPAPERMVMAPGKSLLEEEGSNLHIKDVLRPLDQMMLERLRQTV